MNNDDVGIDDPLDSMSDADVLAYADVCDMGDFALSDLADSMQDDN